jgi:hypothetical protein
MMIRNYLAGALFALAVACTPEKGGAPAVANEAPAAAAQKAAQDTVVGKYVVRYVNGAPPLINIEGHEPTITIGEGRIHFQSQCIYADWTYKLDGEAITTKTYYEPGSGMCARANAPGETAIQRGFDKATTLRRIRRGLFVEGGGHSLELHRILDETAIMDREVELAGEWKVAVIDGKALANEHKVALSADHQEIWWEPGCALQYRLYTIHGRRFDTRPVDLSNLAMCDIGTPEQLARIWSAMDAADTIAPTRANGVVISGNGRSVTLSPYREVRRPARL